MSELQVSINLLIASFIFLISLGLIFFYTRELREQGSFNEESMGLYVAYLTKTKPEKARKIRSNLKYQTKTYITQLVLYITMSFACLSFSLIMAFSVFSKVIKIMGEVDSGLSLVKLYTEGGLAELALMITFILGVSIFQSLYAVARRNCIFSLFENSSAIKQ